LLGIDGGVYQRLYGGQWVCYDATFYIKLSMSRRGNCWNNAVTESFFKTLKVEMVYRQPRLTTMN
jgi:transposase InsO family protein